MAEGEDLLARYRDALADFRLTDSLPERLKVYRLEAEMAELAVRLTPAELLEFIKRRNQLGGTQEIVSSIWPLIAAVVEELRGIGFHARCVERPLFERKQRSRAPVPPSTTKSLRLAPLANGGAFHLPDIRP
jgi:hypothetical protein